ncbi:MAG: gamma-glutamyltransferase [Planctomycetota bacterium]
MDRCTLALLSLTVATLAIPGALAQDRRDATSRDGMVVSISPHASDVGAAVLADGGNAVDAAIATAFALAVTHPSAGNIGGGGFMLVRPSDGSPPVFVDYREKAPLASTLDMFAAGGSRKNHRYVGVPGTVRGLSLAHELYGSKAWGDLVAPAVALAADGFVIHAGLARSLNRTLARSTNDEFKRVYGRADGEAWEAGQRLVLSDLGATLARIRDERNDGFYAGETARLLAAEMERGGGYVTTEDLALYRARVRVPIRFPYRGFEVLSAPPPSSGGITLAQTMQMLEPLELRKLGRWSPEANHLVVEAMRRAYAQRALHLGDADFVDIDPKLWTKAYARELGAGIDRERATSSRELGPRITEAPESDETTHFSVMDRTGMAVSNTYTLEAGYGSGVVVRGAGFLLNNEMGDFNPRPGVTDEVGRIGTDANLVAPQKRMLSSMTPTIVTRDGRVVLVTGSPGGRTIINTVLCVTLNVLEFGMTAREAVDAPRMDHEWFPDRVRFVRGDEDPYRSAVEGLRARGHEVRVTKGQGDANTILVDANGVLHGAADDEHGAAVPPQDD